MKYFQKRIQKLQKLGYAIRLPGGKSRDGGAASFAGILRYVRFRNKEELFILVIPYKVNETILKIKMGSAEERVFPETAEQTVERETQEETGILINKAHYFLVNTLRVPDNRLASSGGIHIKSCFAVYNGYDDTNRRTRYSPTQPSLGIPFWMPLSALEKVIDPRHMWMLKSIIAYLPYIETEIKRVA